LRQLEGTGTDLDSAIQLLAAWDGVLSTETAAGVLYEFWQRKVVERALKPLVPETLWERYAGRQSVLAALELIEAAGTGRGGARHERDAMLVESLREALHDAEKELGSDRSKWRWGALHQARLKHMLAATPVTQEVFNLPPVERPGDGNAPIATGGSRFEQTSGASYRHILDLADWDRSVATSVPGQSGQPGSPHYADLLTLWAEGRYFPLLFTRAAIERSSGQRLVLQPDR
jgi:penicillin amidase